MARHILPQLEHGTYTCAEPQGWIADAMAEESSALAEVLLHHGAVLHGSDVAVSGRFDFVVLHDVLTHSPIGGLDAILAQLSAAALFFLHPCTSISASPTAWLAPWGVDAPGTVADESF